VNPAPSPLRAGDTAGSPDRHRTASALDATAADRARDLFARRCALCHGADGRGDGAASRGLTPRPRNYHDPAWQASVTDEYLARVITRGGAALGRSAAMPSNPDLPPELVAELVGLIRRSGTP
jgi:mono/diheme cytochrome c family protein